MHKTFMNYAFMGICTIGGSGLYSCVDNAYDLNKEIDKTITVGGDLTIPNSSTEEMKLKDILNLEDDSAVRTDKNGNYSIVQTGVPSDSEIKVNEVNIQPDESSFSSIGIDGLNFINGTANIAKEYARSTVNIKHENIDEDIVDIKSVTVKNIENELSVIFFSIKNKNGNTERFFVKKGFKILFPEYMTVESASDFCNANGNTLTFIKDEIFDEEGIMHIYFRIKEIEFEGYNGASFDFDTHTIKLGDEISLDGNLESDNDVNDCTFAADIDCNKLVIESAIAKVNPSVDIIIDPINIENLPDFLTEEGVIFDATDPRIFMAISNDSPLDADMSMELVSEKKGIDSERVRIENIRIDAGCNNHIICIHQNRDIVIDGVENIYCDNLSEVIKYIPEKIRVENITTQVLQDKYYDIELGTPYNINNMYEVNTPLMFGEETYIKYTHIMDGMGKDLENTEFSHIEIMMKAYNRIPLNLSLSAEAIDKDGYTLEGVTVSVEGNIAASNGIEATEKDMVFVVKAAEGSRVRNLDGLKIKITGTATEETSKVQMNENQSLKLEDVKLKLIGGLTMDLN